MTALLELVGLAKRFGGVSALSDLDLAVAPGEILGIMGANGAGKTTLFGLIAGHVRPSAGDIRLEGRSLLGLSPDRICRRGIGRTFQIVRPFGGLSVLENVMVAARFGTQWLDRTAAAAKAGEVLTAVGLGDRRDDLAASLTLSGQKRLEVARAVATGARILLLDEVMAGLTPTEVAEMLPILRRLHRERRLTILIIEHVMQALMRISDRILVLHLGRQVALDRPEAIARNPEVLACYLGEGP
jgi:branched-chain amino acid transport system ATP-binding protein